VRDDVQYFRPLYNLEQVEILRGSNALLFGRGGTGGIVNRVTKKAAIDKVFTGLSASIDTFGAYAGAIDANYALTDNAALRLNGFYEELNNHRDFFEGTRFGFNPTIGFNLSPQTRVDVSYEYLDDDRVVDRGVPSVTIENGADVPLEGFDNSFFGSPDDNLTTLKANILRARIDHSFTENLRGNFTAQYAKYDKRYQNLFAAGFDSASNAVTLDGYNDLTDRTNLIFQANLIAEFQTGSIGHTVLFGAEYADQETQNARFDNVFDNNGDGVFDGNEIANSPDDDQASFAFTDPLVIPAFAFTDLNRNRDSRVEVFSAYLQDQIDLTEKLKVVVGARFDSFDIDVLDIFEVDDGNDGAFSRKDEEISPRFGLIYKPRENISIYGSYSETFLPRSGEQFLTLNLNSSETEPQGFENLEAGLKWDIRPDLSFTAAIFELDRREQGGNNGNRTRQTPDNTFSLWNIYDLTERFALGGGLTYQDRFFIREDNTVEVPDFTRFDAAIYYDVTEDWRLQINVENIFNTDYFPDAHANDNISTGKPLNVRFSLSGQF